MEKKYEIKVLSPVHIGCGDKLVKDIDFFWDGKATYEIDINKLFDSLNNEQINKVSNTTNIVEFMDLEKIDKKPFQKKRLGLQEVDKNEIHKFIADGLGKPYIPGSSLKGAIRTILGQYLFETLRIQFKTGGSASKSLAYNEISKEIFGKDSNHDFLRGFSVVDSFFTPDDLKLHLTKVYTMNGEGILFLKPSRSDGNHPKQETDIVQLFGQKVTINKKNSTNNNNSAKNSNRGMRIFSEFLKKDATSRVRVKIDDFFFSDKIKDELGICQEKYNALLNIRDIANSYAKKMILNEWVIYSKQIKLKAISLFYKDLETILDRISNKNEPSFLLNIGGGTGWHFKTGNYIKSNDLDLVRKKYNLGKIIKKCPKGHSKDKLEFKNGEHMVKCTGCNAYYSQNDIKDFIKPFPKSRKIIFDKNDQPLTVPGWIMLTEI